MATKFKTIFNKQIAAFFTDIIAAYPEEKQFRSLKTQINMAIMMDDEIAIKYFYEYLTTQYKTQIYKKDEKFFLSFDLSGTPLGHLNRLKDVFKSAPKGTQTTIWKYVIVLAKLSEKYYS